MGGAAVALAVADMVMGAGLKLRLRVLVPAVENSVAGNAFRPGDVLRSRAGLSVEIGNTDAEGRLILADAVTYAIQLEGAAKVVDIATLTGACVAALGFTTAGLLTNHEGLFLALMNAAKRAGEQYWRFPDFPEYHKMIESPVADLCNQSSDGCGAIAAGLFLAAFAGETPWLHLDIAGTAWSGKLSQPYQPKGATGMGAATLYQLCRLLGEKG